MKSIVRIGFFVSVGSLFFAAGCQNAVPHSDSIPTEGSGIASISCNGPQIQADCVVTQYQSDGSRYITRQRHWICLAASALTVEADEPDGTYIWQLKQDGFNAVEKPAASTEDSSLCSPSIAQAVLSLFLAGGGYLDVPAPDMETRKVEGVVYQPYDAGVFRQLPAIQGLKTTLLQDVSTRLVDRVENRSDAGEGVLHGHAFNFRRNHDVDKVLPTRIELFQDGVRMLEMTYFHITLRK
ncbi:MAG: hypothetical protein JW828_06870 [Sedimentisphaerales bacterium]|nr:hypothetical protein [Sedimentisphaerales bacterium]